jgi:TolB-like protein/class 3 adenylate cyclase/Tfp pilus assembly protein PilF
MPADSESHLRLEIGYVLFIDIVGYSKLSINDQHAAIEELNRIVRASEQFQRAEAANRLIRIPTGDGMVLAFYTSPEAPVQCAVEISRALKVHPRLQLRMGIHSGPVGGMVDVNERANLAGAGINTAHRVMDCGDAGHILLSKHVAEDLEEYQRWRPLLHDLGSCEVKHGGRVSVVNLYDDQFGNAKLPQRFETVQKRRTRLRWAATVAALLALAGIVASVVVFFRYGERSVPAAPEKSIAVLPFENRSEDKANAYFADGIQDEILTDLAKIADLKVISRTSVMQYKSGAPRNLREIGQQLRVARLVEGSVQRVANRVRVNAQLIDARNDAHLWAQSYDRDLADVFAIQSEIAKAIADQLQAKLSPNEKAAIEKPPTSDVTAFDLYSRAKTLLLTKGFSVTSEQDVRQAVDLLKEAVKRDPSFFDAYCQLANAHERVYGVDHTPARLALAEAAVQAATRLRPDAGETHLARAEYLYYGLRDYAGALGELETARRALPNDPRILELTGYILRRSGQQEEGLRNLERAIEVDPRNFQTLQQLAISYQFLRRFAEEITVLDRALTIVPDNVETRTFRAQVELFWKADTHPLHQTIDSILAQGPGAIATAADDWFLCALAERNPAAAERALVALSDNPCWVEDNILLSRSFGEGLLARMMKDEPRARAAFEAARAQQEKIVQAQPDYGPALCVLSLIDAALGRNEAALKQGRRAIELLPMEKDVLIGSRMLQYFALIAAWTGEKDLAIQQLELGLRAPVASFALSYGVLKLHPFWDPLRGDPRFEKIVASLAPKEP